MNTADNSADSVVKLALTKNELFEKLQHVNCYVSITWTPHLFTSDMMEDQESRSITLLQVVANCLQEVNAARKQTNQFMQPSCSPALHVSVYQICVHTGQIYRPLPSKSSFTSTKGGHNMTGYHLPNVIIACM